MIIWLILNFLCPIEKIITALHKLVAHKERSCVEFVILIFVNMSTFEAAESF